MTATAGKATRLLSVVLGEDAWQGDANAIVRVDGQIAFQGNVTAPQSSTGARIDLGSYDAAVSHDVTVEFTNDAWGGTSQTDRNLYVDDVLTDGVSTGQAAALYSNGVASFRVAGDLPPAALSVGQGPDAVTFSLSEDAWMGDAQFVLTVGGQQVGDVMTTTALHGSGQEQSVTLRGDFSASAQVGVRFLNDAYGGSVAMDRNLYVDGTTLNGVDLGKSHSLSSNGDFSFRVGTAAPVTVGSGAQTIHVAASEDAWQGDALMTISVDGVQVGGELAVTADHATGQVQDFYIKGSFGAGTHTVSVAFINDAWGGSASMDRNLYVKTVAFDGTSVAGASGDLYSNGAVSGAGAFFSAQVVAALPVVSTPPVVVPPAVVGASSDIGLYAVGAPVYAAGSRVLTVGANKQFQTIAAAVNSSQDGDVVLVDAGTYKNDFATVNSKISLLAVGGRVDMVATVPPPNWKGLLTVETDLRVEGFTFEGVHIPDEYGHNGAGIRLDGGNLVLVNDEFDNNQDGLLANAGAKMSVTIDHSVFNDNGGNDGNGAGNIHNVYIGDIASVTVTNSIFENAQVGHEFKSRAVSNTLTNNKFISGVGIGTGSYDIDLPNGGKAVLTDNTIIKGPNAENPFMVHFGGEGIPYAGSSLTLSGNLFQNTKSNGFGVLNQTSVTAAISGNVFDGLGANSIVQGPAKVSGNFDAAGNKLADQVLVGVLPGSTLFFDTDPADHTFILGNQARAIQGGAGKLTIDLETAHVVIIGGSGGIDLTENATTGGNQYQTAAGSTNVLRLGGVGGDTIESDGTDTISIGTGNYAGQLNGHATVLAGVGGGQWNVNGTARIEAGQGSTFMTLSATATLAVTGTNDFYKIDSNGGTAIWTTVNAGHSVAGSAQGCAFSMQVYNGVMHVSTGGGDGSSLHLDTGDVGVSSTGGGDIYAGSGTDIIQLQGGGATVHAGSGSLSVFARGGAGGATVLGAAGDTVLDGDGGGITYIGGGAANSVEARVTYLTIEGGAGLMTVTGGARSTISGGSGGLVFHGFGGGADDVTTAAGSRNTVEVNNSNVHSFGTDTIVSQGGNNSFDLHGTSSLQLQQGVSYVDLYGNDALTTANGYDHITAHAGAAVTLSTTTMNSVHLDGASVSATFTDANAGGAVSTASMSSGTGDLSTAPGGISVSTSGSAPMSVSVSGQVIVNSNGADAIRVGDGFAQVTLHAAGAEVWAGAGSLALHAYGPDGSAFILHGGSGSVALDEGGSRMTFVGGTGSASLALDGNGADITFGSGASHVSGLTYGTGNAFHFLAGQGGTDLIDSFRVGTDKASLGAGVTIASASVAGGSAHFLLSNGADVTFTGLADTRGVFG